MMMRKIKEFWKECKYLRKGLKIGLAVGFGGTVLFGVASAMGLRFLDFFLLFSMR